MIKGICCGLRTARRTALATVAGLLALGSLSACSSKILKAENSQEILKNDEFERAIQVQEIPPAPSASGSRLEPSGTFVRLPGPEPVPGAFAKAKSKQKTKAKKDEMAAAPNPTPAPPTHEPDIEDAEGFVGRRPVVDPYRVGEKVTLEVSYFGVSAGDMTVEVRPFVQVNGRKSYNFAGTAISTSVFAMFYAVDDWFETYVDYETLTPSSYALHVKETKQLRETRSVFDWTKSTATWWDKKIDADQKVEEKKKEWEIPPFSQNVFTAAFYIRAFQLKPGKKITYRVAHEAENLVLTAEVLRKERISTPVGELDTVVIKPKIELNGVFKPVGDIFMWLTDDDRKLIVRIESKIKIGTIVGLVKAIER